MELWLQGVLGRALARPGPKCHWVQVNSTTFTGPASESWGAAAVTLGGQTVEKSSGL